jgi:hypothetical protein
VVRTSCVLCTLLKVSRFASRVFSLFTRTLARERTRPSRCHLLHSVLLSVVVWFSRSDRFRVLEGVYEFPVALTDVALASRISQLGLRASANSSFTRSPKPLLCWSFVLVAGVVL